jgi:hypothetical protein
VVGALKTHNAFHSTIGMLGKMQSTGWCCRRGDDLLQAIQDDIVHMAACGPTPTTVLTKSKVAFVADALEPLADPHRSIRVWILIKPIPAI